MESMKDEVLVECHQIEKSLGKNLILQGIDLKFFSNKITLLIGENGAGKTTLCKVLALLLKPNSGKIFYKGKEVKDNERIGYRKDLGYLSHQTFTYSYLTAIENLIFFADLYGIKQKKDKIEKLLIDFGIYKERNQLAGTFSRGMQQRLALTRVLLNDPKVLILDEPFSGLDPAASQNLLKILSELKNKERTIIVVTHEINEIVEIVNTCVILKNGKKVFDGPFYSRENLIKIYLNCCGEMQ